MFLEAYFAATDSTITATNYKTITNCSSGATCTTTSPTSMVYQTSMTTITNCSPGAKCSAYSTAVNTASVSVVYDKYTASVFTTYCPAATTLTVNGRAYTVTTPTTLTISNCPCTIARTTTSGGRPTSAGSSRLEIRPLLRLSRLPLCLTAMQRVGRRLRPLGLTYSHSQVELTKPSLSFLMWPLELWYFCKVACLPSLDSLLNGSVNNMSVRAKRGHGEWGTVEEILYCL
jgi:hypothetical protein